MTSLKDYSMNIPEQAYHDYPAWSYSIIAKYAKNGFPALTTLHDKVEPTESMRFGSLFDTIMTKPEEFDNYAVLSVSVPEAERKALDYISSKTTLPLSDISREDMQNYCTEASYYAKWGYDAHLSHLLPFESYYEMKKSGKEIISEKDYQDAMYMANAIRSNSYLKNIFGTESTSDIEYLYQLQFVVDYAPDQFSDPVKIKIMPDLLVVNHKKKEIRPVDLKTSSVPAYQFADNFLTFRYDIQASLYTDILGQVISSTEDYKSYTILPYLFADISRSDCVPVCYEYNPKAPEQENGFTFSRNGRSYTYKTWKVLLAEILKYEEENAKVPSYIKTDEPNNLLEIISNQ